jgi:cytochrome c553
MSPSAGAAALGDRAPGRAAFRSARALGWVVALAAGLALPVSAAPPPRLNQCLSCHGADGRSPQPMVPHLASQPRVFLENTLIMIREGLRPVAAKRGLLDGVGDAEVSALADYFSRQAAPPGAAARDEAAFRRGQALASQGLCGTCHLPNYAGQQQMPRLAGQREEYLSHSMKRFRDNQAEGRDTMMNGVLRGLSDAAVADLAHYFSQLR